jgi:hypothetical protein
VVSSIHASVQLASSSLSHKVELPLGGGSTELQCCNNINKAIIRALLIALFIFHSLSVKPIFTRLQFNYLSEYFPDAQAKADY